jgi:predicted Zn-dependent protease
MPKRLRKAVALTMAGVLLIGLAIAPDPAAALSKTKEEELSREFMKLVGRHLEQIRDPMVTLYVEELGRRILATIPHPQFEYRFHVVRESSYNAFAGPAGHIFVHSGLFGAMEREEELAGILAHEIAHVECRHISQKVERSTTIGLATLAGVAAGLLLGVGGAASAASALTMGSVAAAQAVSLAYSREDEMQADQIGLGLIERSGYSAAGLVTLLHRFRDRQWVGSSEIPTYLKTHPASEDRIGVISAWLEARGGGPPPSPEGDRRFGYVAARVAARYGDPEIALRRYGARLRQAPQDPAALYGYALALAESGNRRAAIEQLTTALLRRAFDPTLLAELGRIYYLDGQFDKARSVLEGAADSAPEHAEGRLFLARILREQGEEPRALEILERIAAELPEYPPVRYQLGEIYGQQGKLPEAHLNLGIYFKLEGDLKNSLFHLQKAATLAGGGELRRSAEALLREVDKQKRDADREAKGQRQG